MPIAVLNIEEIFHAAREKPPGERAAFLRGACHNNPDTMALLESLLVCDEAASDFLETPAAQLIGSVAATIDRSGWIGATIGNYRIERIIAAGGMGVVYEAQQASPRRRVALKLLRRGLDSASAMQRFRRESELLGRLRHDGVAQIYEAGVHREEGRATPFFAMEYIEGGIPLTNYAQDQLLGVPERIELLCQICDAVQYCHDQGVIHRDLKPANILVTSQGRPKIIDFGVAQAQTTGPGTQSWHTIGNPLIGSWPYMSPEQVGGDAGSVGAQTDVYALGVIAFELLADRLPLDLANLPPLEAARMIREEEPLRLRSVDRRLSADLETIAGTALAKEKARRYPTAAALAADFRRFLGHEPIQARRAGAAYQLSKFVRRNRALSGGVAVAFTGLLIGGIAAAWQASTAIRERNAARVNAQQAHRERIRAEENLRKARDVVDNMLTRAANDLWNTPHMTELQRELYEQALTFYEGFLEQRGDDSTIRLETARACIRTAQIHDHLGNQEKRLAFGRRAVEISQRLTVETPEETEYRVLLADSYNVCAIQKPPTAWDDWLQPGLKELEIRQELVQLRPDVPEYLRMLAHRHVDVGNGYQKMGKLVEAEAHCRQALGYWEQYRRDFPSLPILHDDGDEAHAHLWLGDLVKQAGRFEEALFHMSQAVEIRRRLVAEKPDHYRRRYELGTARIWLGRGLYDAGQTRDAEQQFRAAAEIFEPLTQLFPELLEYQDRRMQAIRGLAKARRAQGDFAGAEALLRAHLAQSRELYGEADERTGEALYELAVALNRQGNSPEAQDLRAQVLARYRSLRGEEHVDVANIRRNLGMALFGAEEFTAAESIFREALLAHPDAPAAGYPSMDGTMGMLGASLLEQGRYDEAEHVLRECLSMRQQLYPEDHPKVWRRHNAASLLGAAMAGQAGDLAAEDPSAATELFAQAEQLLVEGYDGMKNDPSVPPPPAISGIHILAEAMERIVQLYEAWDVADPGKGHDQKAANWREIVTEAFEKKSTP